MAGSKDAGVVLVISFFNSSRVYPTANNAAIFAIGKPVALDAKADDLDTLGFISITTISPFFGFIANWTFDPPVSTPISLNISMEAILIFWYSLSVSVSAGATVIESPVWTPIGSTFSIEHIMIQLSDLSLTTSISYSFHPATDSSTRISFVGELSIPFDAISINSLMVEAIPPPVPPSVNEGRIMTGKPISSNFFTESSKFCEVKDFGVLSPIFFIASLNLLLSSALDIASSSAPINSTLFSFKKPDSETSSDTFKPVWPPIVGRIASGFSFLIIFFKISGVIGSIYVLSATSGSVIIVAGLEFTKIIL